MLISSAPLDHWTQACFPSFVTLVLFPCQTLSSLFQEDCKGSPSTLNCQNLNGQIFTVVFSLTPNEDIRLEDEFAHNQVLIPIASMHLPVKAECPFTSVRLHTTVFLVALKPDGRWTNAMILSPRTLSISRVKWSSGLKGGIPF